MNPEDQNPGDPVEAIHAEGILPEEEAELPAVGAPCSNHPEMVSISHCQICAIPICATCAFIFPGDVAFCPDCVQSPAVNQIDPKRTRNIRWALGLGIWAIIGSVAFFIGTESIENEEELEVIGMAFSVAVLLPNLAGLVLALTTREKRLADPKGTKPAIWLNAIVFGLLLLSMAIGSCMPA